MAKTKISEFSSTPANNTDINNINIAEGCSPANLNNAVRSLMAQLKDQQAGTSGDGFTVAGTLTASGTLTSSGTLAVTGALTLDGDAGTSGQALVSAGSGNTPTWTTLATMASQNANAVTISGGTINGTTLGATTPAAGTFSTLTSSSVAITGGTISGTTVNSITVGSNASGTKTISTSAPTGGSNGDVWYRY